MLAGRSCPGLGTAETCSCSQYSLQLKEWLSGRIRALQVCSQPCANPALADTELEGQGRCPLTPPSTLLTDLAADSGFVAASPYSPGC